MDDFNSLTTTDMHKLNKNDLLKILKSVKNEFDHASISQLGLSQKSANTEISLQLAEEEKENWTSSVEKLSELKMNQLKKEFDEKLDEFSNRVDVLKKENEALKEKITFLENKCSETKEDKIKEVTQCEVNKLKPFLITEASALINNDKFLDKIKPEIITKTISQVHKMQSTGLSNQRKSKNPDILLFGINVNQGKRPKKDMRI